METTKYTPGRSRWTLLVLALWAGPLSIVMSLILGLHYAPHAKEPLLGIFGANEGIQVHHFLSLDCKCSQGVLEHLVTRRGLPGLNEIVHLVSATAEQTRTLTSTGYKVDPIAEEDAVTKYHLQSVPQLVVVRGNEVLYQGGYGPDQQHLKIYEDVSILQNLQQGKKIREYPIFGCANGTLRKSALDILGVKYGIRKPAGAN